MWRFPRHLRLPAKRRHKPPLSYHAFGRKFGIVADCSEGEPMNGVDGRPPPLRERARFANGDASRVPGEIPRLIAMNPAQSCSVCGATFGTEAP